MANTSAQVRNRWNDKHYDRITFLVPKGTKNELQKLADERGMTAAQIIRDALIAHLGWPDWPKPEEGQKKTK